MQSEIEKKTKAAQPGASPSGPGIFIEDGRTRFLACAFTGLPDAIFFVDAGGLIVEANDAACSLLGYSRDDFRALAPWGFLSGASFAEIPTMLRGLSSDKPAAAAWACRRKSGQLVVIEAKVAALQYEDRNFFSVCAREFKDERTDQLREISQCLLDSEQRLRLAVETGRIGLWVWNATDTANAGDWSDRLKEIFGFPLSTQVTHELFLSRIHPEDRARVDREIMDALAGVNAGNYHTEFRIVHPSDGSTRWAAACGKAFFDPEGRAIRFIGTLMEITERKRAEEAGHQLNMELERRIEERTGDLARINRALSIEIDERKRAELSLRQSQDNLRVAIDAIPGLVWSSQPDGYIDYLNKRWIDYTGLTLEQASGWGWQAAIHPDDLPGLLAYWKSILESGSAGEYEARLRRHDGEHRWFLFSGTPLMDAGGKLVKWYGTNIDVNERRASEHLARGQLNALTRTLDALSRETSPEKFLEHVLRTMSERMGAHGISVWELNQQTAQVEFVGICEDDRLQLTSLSQKPNSASGAASLPRDHPVWAEFFSSGEFCVIGEVVDNDIRIRVASGGDTPWHHWCGDVVAHPDMPAMIERLLALGIVYTLAVPMFVAGKVTGFLSIRFRRKRDFAAEEIELARALAHHAMLALQLIRLTHQSRNAAVAAERNRLARDIHDTLAQGFTGVIVQLEAAEDAQSQGLASDSAAHLQRAGDLARESLREARRSVYALRPLSLAEKTLCAAISEWIAKMTAGTGVTAEFTVTGALLSLPQDYEENLLRICQEALTNVLRHAGATRFQAHLAFAPKLVRLELRDNGRGFEPASRHEGFGLLGMRERAESMGGELSIQSVPAQGTLIAVSLPLTESPSSFRE